MTSALIVPVRTPPLDQSGNFVFAWIKFFQSIVQDLQGNLAFSVGTHAERLKATAGANGSLYVETDRQVAYIAINGVWVYFVGRMPVAQDSLPTDLTANDDRFQVFVTDYVHLLQWDGQGLQWGWAPGDMQSGYHVPFVSAPNPTTGWQACDGTADVAVLQSDGSLNYETVPIVAGDFYRQ